MKTTLEIDDGLYREAKAVAALSGHKMKELVSEGLRLVLAKGAVEGLDSTQDSGRQIPLVRAGELAAYPDGAALRRAFPRGYRLAGALIPARTSADPLRAEVVDEAMETMDQEELDAHARPG